MSEPARLNKTETNQSKVYTELIEGWVIAHPKLVFIMLFITLAMLFGILFHVLYNMCTIESGVMRNFMVNNL